MEDGSPMIPSGGTLRYHFTPRPAGTRWFDHDARRDLKLAWPNAKRIVRTRFLCRPPASPRWTRAGNHLVPQHDGS